MFNDLREFIKRAEELGHIAIVEGADWNLEIGHITELGAYQESSPCLLFDKIKGYSPGYRILTNFFKNDRLLAEACGVPWEGGKMGMVKSWRDWLSRDFKLIPPVEVKTGPIMENIDIGDDVDLFKFPVPKWHKHDGGREIGTACMVINRDPDDGWVNLGTYRVQAYDKNRGGMFIAPGRHGDIIRKKYWAKGLPCPVAVVCGCEPLLFSISGALVPQGISEYDYTGWLINKPIEIVKGKTTDLPIPANAEIVLEGDLMPPEIESRQEGPFGEFTGYYASGARDESVYRVKSVMYRNDPIILGAPPIQGCSSPFQALEHSGRLWMELNKKLPAIKGVWMFSQAGGPAISVVSLEQKFPGHAKQATMFVSGYYANAEPWRFIIAVDEDIDPSNIGDVLWALGTRCDPETAIDILRGCRGTPLDPLTTPEDREHLNYVHSRALVNACKPYHWIKEFPLSTKSSLAELAPVKEKWGKIFNIK